MTYVRLLILQTGTAKHHQGNKYGYKSRPNTGREPITYCSSLEIGRFV